MDKAKVAILMLGTGLILSAICTCLAFGFEGELSIAAITAAHLGCVLGLMLIKLGYILHLDCQGNIAPIDNRMSAKVQ